MSTAIKSLLLHVAVFVTFCVAMHFLLYPTGRDRPVTLETRPLSDIGVSIVIGENHITVSVDDQSERIPRGVETDSPIYKEAIRRMAEIPVLDETPSRRNRGFFSFYRRDRVFVGSSLLVFTLLYFNWWRRNVSDGKSSKSPVGD